MAIAPSLAAAQSAPAGVTNIIPDGRTATTVTTNGSVSTVTTGTISGPNAFNSFSQFQIGAGNTGNLILPGGTSNLINLINGNNPAVINGVMNSYKNGQIGGNVYFAAPGGFIVGRSGVVNVGSLNVTTPTREFVDGVISPSGQINQGAVNNLLAGTVPISPDGNIRIRGRVNAVDAVRLTGQNVFVGNMRDAVNRDHAVKFASTVNSKGLRSSNGIVVRNGSIQIVANDSAKINGRLAARKNGGKGGDIVVLASGAIRIGGAAALNARGKTGDAGNIIVKAGTNLTVDSGARFNAGSAAGGAGVVELSSFGTFHLAQGFKVDIGGANGKNGVLLIDPNDVVIGDAALDTGVNMSNADVANSIAAIAGGGTWALSGDSITVAANGVIDGRKLGTNGKSNADSVSIELDAPVISVFGKILANAENDATSTFLAGDVRLNAVQSVNLIAGLAEATTLIEVGGNALIKGKNIALNSNATAISSYLDSAAGIAALIGQSAAASAIGLNGGYVAGTSSATITIRDTATIDGTGNVDIASSARQVASDPAVTIGGASPVAVAVTVGEISGTVNTTVGTGTHVYAGGNLNITGQNDAQLNVIAIGMSSDAQAAATVAYGTASVNTNTVVQTGADLKVGGNLYVGARNINSFNVSATSYALGQTGKAGVAIAYSDVGTTATATLGANVGASGTPIPGSVTVEANSGMPNSSQDATNTTSSTAAAGNPILIDLVAKGAASFTQKKFTDFVAVKAPASSRTDLKFAGALSLAFSDQAAKASIAATSPGSAPSINAAGNVAVVAKVSDVGVSSLADASTNSQEIADPNASSTQSQAKTAVALGVAIGNYGHHANAFIGQGVSVCCANLGVSATVEMPITINWLTYDSLGTWLAKFNGNLGTVNQVLTSYANAASQAQDATRVGAANYFAVDNSATAWVGEGATITRNSATPAAPWSTVLADGTSLAWDQAIAVQAATRTASIDVGGNFSWLGLTGNSGQQNEAGHSQGEAIGGAVNIVSYKNRTIAGISDGVTVTSNGEVGVSAKNENVIFAVSPTSGAGNADSYNGIAAVALIDDVAHASISNSARITAPAVDINADEVLSIFSVGGAVASSESTAVGLVVAINQIVADTAAYIGDNRTDITGSRDAANDPGTASSVAGYVHADDLQIDAQSYGVVTAATVAATKASNNGSSGSTFFNKFVSLLSKSDDASGGAAAKSNSKSGTTTPTFGLALSGSTSINISEVNTSAYVSGAVIDKNSATVAASVQAVNNTIMAAGAGSAALDMAKKQGDKSAAIAGAVAINISGNATRAYADNSIISDARSFSALALSGGEQTSVGIGLAINQSADKDKAASAAGSVSIAVVTDLVDAHVSGSTITVDPALISATLAYTDAFIVAAYQTTDIGVGGGSLYFGGKTGFGFALTYTKIGDPSGLKAVNAHVTDSTVTGFFNATVSASYASRVGAGAGLFGYQKGNGGTGVGFGVSLVITEISPTVNASIDGGSVVEVAGLSQMSPVVYASTVVSTTQLTDTADTDYTETGRFVNPLDPGTTYYAYNVAHTVMELRRGDVAVSSNGTRIGAFDSAIASAARTGGDLVNTGLVDFSGAAIAAEGTNSGASITAVAGLIQGGANSVGFAITASTINQSNIATIDHARVVSDNGDVVVTADSSADILGVAVGIAVSDGKFAGLASSSINLINNTVSAAVGGSSATPSNTVVEGANLVVRATDNADIRGAAGTLGIGLGSAAAGLSVTYDQIGNSVTAAISGAKVAVDNDVLLNAASNADILSIAIGIAVSKNVGIAGSVVTNISDTNVTARIDSGADVTASNNVGVIADNTDTMKVVAGALGVGLTSAGVGISVVVNDVKGATTATIAGAATKVDAYAVGGSALSVNSGTLAQSFDVSTADNPNLDIPDLSENQRSVSGVAVVASSHQAVVGVDVTIGLSAELLTGDALALAPVTSLMGGSTTASIDGAQVGTRLANSPSASIAPEIFVGAGSLSYSRNLVIAGSGAGGFSGAGAIAANRMERATHAFIQDATIGTSTRAVGNVAINAAATQIASDIAVGLAVGVAGAGASIIVNVFSADTQAYLTHGALYASNLAVNALSTEGYFAAGGAAAVNFLGGFAGAFVVGVSQNTTKAYIGDTDDDTSVTLANDLAVNAQSDNTFYSYAIGGSAAGTGAVAGMVDFTVVNNHTEATMTNVTDTQTAAGSDVTVSATENVVIRPTAGAGAVGLSGAGIGASINVVLLKSQVASGIVDSAVDTKGAVNVTATSNKDIDMQTVTFGAGGSVGIAASISLLLAGQTAPGDATDQISASVSTIDSATNSVPADNGIASDDVPGSGNPPAGRPPSYSLANALGSANDAVTAEITGGSTKAGSVKAEATASVKTKNTASGVGLGGTVGVGAALGYSLVYDTVAASIEGDVTSDKVDVLATMQDNSGHAVEVNAYAGAGALGAAVGAAVAVGTINNTVAARLAGKVTGSGVGTAANKATASALDTSSVSTQSVGAAIAAGALGISVANSTKSSLVYATVPEGAVIGGYSGVAVRAEGRGRVVSDATAGAGGVIAGSGAGANSVDNENIIAEVGTSKVREALDDPATPTAAAPSITVGLDGLEVRATGAPEAAAKALGISVGAAGVGASVALATVNPSITAFVDSSASIITAPVSSADTPPVVGFGALSVIAEAKLPSSGRSADAWSVAGTGGYLIGANATDSEATNNSHVYAGIGNNVLLPLGNVSVKAINTTSQTAFTTGVSVGYIALGVAVALTTADTSTVAEIGTSVTTADMRPGNLTVSAVGSDTVDAEAVSGVGGVVAGNGAGSNTTVNSNVAVKIGNDSDIDAGLVSLIAAHTTTYKAKVSTVNASLAGASGAAAVNKLDSNVNVDIGKNVQLTGLSNACGTSACLAAVTMVAENDFVQGGSGDSATGAGGGVLNGAAVEGNTKITGHAAITIADADDLAHRTVILAGTDPFGNPGGIRMTAFSTFNATDTVSLETGGAITSAGANTTVNAELKNDVTVGNFAELTTFGSIGLGTFTQMSVDTGAYVSTYGIAAVGAAAAFVDLTDRETVTIKNNATLNAFGNVTLTPGQDPGGNFRTVLMTGRSDAQSYVRGLIAIPDATGETKLTTDSNLVIGDDVYIGAGQNVTLAAYEGAQSLESHGDAHGYILLLIPVTTSDSDRIPVQTSKITIGARTNVVAGQYHEQTITIDCGALPCTSGDRPTLSVAAGSAPFSYFDYTDPNGPLFDVAAYINSKYDPDVKGVLLSSVAGAPVPAFQLGTLFASGGSVTINARTLEGAGTITAYGSPKINVTANSPAYLIFSGAYIPDLVGGQVNFTGAATEASKPAEMVINRQAGDGISKITLVNNFTGQTGSTGFGPAMLFDGDVTNLGGTITINNLGGSYGTIGNTNAQGIDLNVPNGAAVISNPGPGGYYGPVNAFGGFDNLGLRYPGGSEDRGDTTPNGTWNQTLGANIAAEYVANILFQPLLGTGADQFPNLSAAAYGFLNAGSNQHFPGTGGNAQTSTVFFNNCIPGVSGACSNGGYIENDGPLINSNYIFASDGRYLLGNLDGHGAILYAPISYRALSYSTNNASLRASGLVSTFGGGNVAIKAAIIDINAKIVIGRPAEQTVTIPQAIESTLAQYRTDYLSAVQGGGALPNPIHDIPGLLTALDAATQGRGTAVYDASSNQIIITDTNASSSGGRLTMNGAIISTSTLGNIEVNGGLGQVTIDNQTAIPMVINKVNTGSLGTDGTVVSTVKITDTLRPTATNTTTYRYTAGQGVLAYVTSNGDDPTLTGPNATPALVLANTVQYGPVTGARLQWVQQAELTRSLDNAGAGQWSWAMPSDQPNNPWMFVSGAALTNPAYDANQKTASGDLVSQAHPQGIVVIGSPNDAKLTQTITGGISAENNTGALNYSFSGWDGLFNEYAKSAPGQGGGPGDPDNTTHTFILPTALWLKVTSSVKADNPFNIAFKGGTVGSVNVTSMAPVTFADQVTNSSGTTRVSAAGSITQGGDAFVRTKSLILDATNGQGAAANNATSGIGTFERPFAATLNGGVVTATAGSDGIYMNLTGTSTVGRVAAKDANGYGDINYRKTGDILAASGTDAVPINFIGDNISLTAIGGKIGDVSTPIVISANSTLDQNGAAVGGEVEMTAQGDINFKQTSETPGGRLDLRLKTISSASGDVTIEVTNGALVDARGLTAGDALSQDQVDAISQLLHLTGADGADQSAIDRSVTPFEKLITNNYNRYFRMKSDACAANCPTLEVSAATLAYYRPLAQAGLGLANADLTDAMVTAYIATLHEKDTYILSDSALALYRPLAMAALKITKLADISDSQVRAYADAQYQGIIRDFGRAYGADTNWKTLPEFAAPNYVSYLRLKGENCTANCATFSVSDAALAFYRPLAAAALQVGSPTDAQVRDYIATAHNANGAVNLTTDALGSYRAAAQSAIGGSTPVTDAEVRAYADAKFQGYANDYSGIYGVNWASQGQFAAQKGTYAYSISDVDAAAGLRAELTARAVWDPAQIVAGIDQTAFQPVSPTVGNGTPNIVARNVNLIVGGGIGVLAAPVPVALSSLVDGGGGTLTNEQKAAIAAANTPGAVTTVGVDSQGQVVRGFSVSDIPAGVTVTGVEINRQAPIFVSASGTFSASATAGAAFVQSTGAPDLTVGQVVAQGDVALTSPKSILVAANQLGALFAQQVKTLGNLTLTAGSGDIGAAGRSFTYAADGNLVAAQASGSVYLNYAGGIATPKTEMTIGRVFAGQTVSMNSATGGISSYLPGLAITAQDIWLNAAGGDIGAPGNALNVRTDGGALTGTASGGAYVNSPTIDGQAPVPLTIASLAANGAITVTSDFDLVAQSVTSANGDIVIGSGANAAVTSAAVTARTGSAGITVTAFDDLKVGSLTAPGRVFAQAGGAMTITAEGALTSVTDAIQVAANALAMQANSLMSAAKTIAVTTLGDAIVGKLISAFVPGAPNTAAISVAAGDATHVGQIQGNGDGQTNFTVTRPDSAVVLIAANGMGTEVQPLTVDTPWLSATAMQGDIHINSLGDVHVRTLAAPGKLDLTTTGALIFDEVKGDDIVLKSNGKLNVGNVEVTNSVQLIGTEIAGTIVQTSGAPGPLSVTIMGPNGTLAQNAVVVIDPPATIIPQLLAVDATITNIGPSFTVQHGYVSGQLTLFMNGQTFVMNNRSPAPLGGVDVQLYQPGAPFYFSQNGIRTYTSGYVVNYGLGVDPTALSLFDGMSFTRDVPRDMWNGGLFDSNESTGTNRLRRLGRLPSAMLEAAQFPKAVETIGDGPAVNIDGLQ